MSVIGDRMRELRGPSSLREMADAIGIKFNAWARYESGTVLPGAEIIEKICRVHACSANWLLGLPERVRTHDVTVQGTGNVVATGPHAVAISGTSAAPGEYSACKRCPYKKWGDKLRKDGLQIPGL